MDAPGTTVRLASISSPYEKHVLSRPLGGEYPLPALLVSFAYFRNFARERAAFQYRDYMLDSGAFTAWNLGKPIVLGDFIAACRQLRATDPRLSEIIALDVIGSGRGSLENWIAMNAAGIESIPVFHIGDDWSILAEYQARGARKIGLSCRFGEPMAVSHQFYEQAFARAWPQRFHSFGWCVGDVLQRYPFDSADASTWKLAPNRFNTFHSLGGTQFRGRREDRKKIAYHFRCEVARYLDMERGLALKWGPLFQKLGWRTAPKETTTHVG